MTSIEIAYNVTLGIMTVLSLALTVISSMHLKEQKTIN